MTEKRDPTEAVRLASASLARQVEECREQSKYRDHEIRQAKDAGVSWEALMEASGLSRRGLYLSLHRTDQA